MRIIILGAGYAGVVCALRLARKSRSAEIVLVNASEEFVERIRLHERAAGRPETRRTLKDLIRNSRVHFLPGRAERIDREAKRVQVGGQCLPYDRLVLALGSLSALTEIPGVQAQALGIDAAGMESLARRMPGRTAGLEVNHLGQVLVDAQLRSVTDPAICVAGDMAAPIEWVGDVLPMGCKSALPTGAHVADNLARSIAGLPELPFSFAAPFFCVSLGRRRGLIQMPRADGSLTGPIVTGRSGAWFKELICRATVWSLALERSVGLSYRLMRHRNHASGMKAEQPRVAS